MKKLISLALALLVAALLISSCAKDDDNGTADTTVSYTHLDVYKRQTYHLWTV